MASLPLSLASPLPPSLRPLVPSFTPNLHRGLLPTPVTTPLPIPALASGGSSLPTIRRSARRARSPASQDSGGSRPRTRHRGAGRGVQPRAQCTICLRDVAVGHLPRHVARCQGRIDHDNARRGASNGVLHFPSGGALSAGAGILGSLPTPLRGTQPRAPPSHNWVLDIPELPLSIFQPSRVHLVTRIPAAARPYAAATLRQVLHTILEDHIPIGPWHVFMAFPRLILRKPSRGGLAGGNAHRVAALIRLRCQRLQNGEWTALLAEFQRDNALVTAMNNSSPPSSVSPARQRARAIRLARAGEYSRAMASLTAGPMAPATSDTFDTLQTLHPHAPGPLPSWAHQFIPPEQLRLSSETIVAALRGASRLSGAGPSGMTFEHLRDLFLAGDGLGEFGQFCSLIAAGRTPPPLAPLLAASRLVALSKGDGGVRPIAMGECLYRVVARAISIEYRELLSAFFLPDQYAVATRAGCETVAWGAKVFTEVHDNSAILQLDVSNAFNTISRTAICEGLRDSPLSCILPFFRSFYSFSASLFYLPPGQPTFLTLTSSTGTRQGDPLGGALFAFGHKVALDRAKARAPSNVLFPTFADDTYIIATPEHLPLAYAAFCEELTHVGLHVSPAKCRLWAPSSLMLPDNILPELQRAGDDFSILGIPCGPPAAVEVAMQDALEEWSRGLDLLPDETRLRAERTRSPFSYPEACPRSHSSSTLSTRGWTLFRTTLSPPHTAGDGSPHKGTA